MIEFFTGRFFTTNLSWDGLVTFWIIHESLGNAVEKNLLEYPDKQESKEEY